MDCHKWIKERAEVGQKKADCSQAEVQDDAFEEENSQEEMKEGEVD
jgi:hypothetical protein